MNAKDFFAPRNRRVRLLVGLLLAVLFCVQCTRVMIQPDKYISVIPGEEVVKAEKQAADAQISKLAKDNHIALLEKCLDNYKNTISSYRCTLVKQERIGGSLLPEQVVDVKFMQSPFSVAMAWQTNPGQGDRVLYVQGKWNDKMIVRPTNALARALAGGSVAVDPRGKDARAASLRTVDEFGFERSLQNLLEVYRKAKAAGDLKEQFGGYLRIANRDTLVIVRLLPPKDDYPAAKTETFIDLERLVPICVRGWGWQKTPELLCNYVYKDIRWNEPLKAADFFPEANEIKGRK
ncbi:MAG: DUF1571 domain-containing protein [Planctomycetaceae bacterium]|nr:DUF1571 domain-containing protein [Planctomycetaceae bacterium]